MNHLKYLTALLLTSTMLVSMASAESSVRFANTNGDWKINDGITPGIMPLYDYTDTISASLSFSDGKAYCAGTVFPSSDYAASITVTLYKKNGTKWNYITSWTSSSTGGHVAAAGGSIAVDKGTYKVVTRGNVANKEYPTKSITQTN